MRWEWDEAKRLENIRKHRIDFRDVSAVFDGPMLLRLDQREDYGEERWIALGLLGHGVVVVVYTERDGDTIHIISARKANRWERDTFERGLPNRLGLAGRPFGR